MKIYSFYTPFTRNSNKPPEKQYNLNKPLVNDWGLIRTGGLFQKFGLHGGLFEYGGLIRTGGLNKDLRYIFYSIPVFFALTTLKTRLYLGQSKMFNHNNLLVKKYCENSIYIIFEGFL